MAKAKSKKNRYTKKAKKASILGNMQKLPTKGDVKNTLLETGKDLLIGVIGGGLVGAAIGKPSLLIGLGLTGAGHFMDNRLATIFGIGIMASNGFQSKSVDGLDGVGGVKERITAYKDSFSEKLFIDKLLKRNSGTSGFGNLQYFNYQNEAALTGDYELSGDLAALDSIERQIEESGMRQLQMQGTYEMEGYEMEGTDDGIEGVDGIGLADIAGYNL
ncbi:MAG TPA: hypothetical protein VEB40_16200 [Flavipsychrobacter sp.]|nr:hypothetical protein [Flavipsychrobacter sp.]